MKTDVFLAPHLTKTGLPTETARFVPPNCHPSEFLKAQSLKETNSTVLVGLINHCFLCCCGCLIGD